MPRAKITKSFVESVPYKDGGQITFCDTELAGFYLVVGKTAKTYIVQKDLRGRSVRQTIGRHGQVTTAQARDVAAKKLFMISQGIDPNETQREKDIDNITIAQIFENYCLARKSMKPRTKADYTYYLDFYLADWKNKRVASITKDEVVKKHIAVGTKHGHVVANRSMKLIRALINHAIKTYDLNITNPVSYLSHIDGWFKEKPRTNYIKSKDLAAWWVAVDDLSNKDYRDFFKLLLFTGLRRTEALSIEWKNVDFNERVIVIPETKNGDPLSLPISDFIFDMLRARFKKYGHRKFVFPAKSKSGHMMEPKKGIKKVIETSGVSFTCHDLRRTFATYAESLGISEYAIKRLMNHRVTGITGRYIIIDTDRLREPVNKIAEYICSNVDVQKT